VKKKLFNRDFVLLLQANAVSTIGDLMCSVATGYWVYEKTGSNALLGIMSSISMFVVMLLSPFTGSIVDKSNRKWLMVGMDVMQGILMITVGILAHLDLLNVPGVLLTAFLAAVGSVFYSPAANTLLLDIIPRDDMVRGQSIFSGCNSLISTLGTAVSGVVVAFFGVPLIVILNGVSNLYSAFSEMFIRVPRSVQQGEAVTVKSVLSDSRQAVKDIFQDKFLRLFIPMNLIINLLGAGCLTLILPFCLEKGFSVEHYGYLMTAFTVGSLLCVLLLSVVKLKPAARFWVMALGFCGYTVFAVLAFLSRSFPAVFAFLFVAAFLNCAGNTIFNASQMLALPEKNRGAIMGFVQSASTGGSALSALVYGLLGDVFPLYLVFAVGSIIAFIPMLYLCANPLTKKFILEYTE
jgi:MFS family permease